MKSALLLIISLGLISCTSTSKSTLKNVETIKKIEAQSVVIEKKLDKKSKVYVDASIKALEKAVAKTEPNKEVNLALRLLRDTQEIIGTPLPNERIDIDPILNNDPVETKRLEDMEKEHRVDLVVKEKLQEEITVLNSKIVDQAKELAQIQNKSWYQKFKESIASYIIVFALALGLVLFGPTLFRLILRLIKPI